MYVFNKVKPCRAKKQGRFIAKIPMKMIFIDEIGQAFEYANKEFIYRFCVYMTDNPESLK